MHDEGEVLLVQVLDQPVEPIGFLLAIRRVAHQREPHVARHTRLCSARWEKQDKKQRYKGFHKRRILPRY